jgi:hypothetical protein
MLPYEFSIPYKQLVVEQHLDKGNGLIYVAHNGKKLYFPRHFSPQKIDNCYKTLLIEQDGASPHRYVEFPNELTGKTLLDVGAAEGIFALDVIDFAEQVYLFECEDYWIEALQATFAPYKNKTSIVKKYVSNRNDEINVTIDTLLEEKGIDNLFVKMDIEGAELSALQGAIHTIKTGKNISLAICTYHRPNDAADISNLFANVGLKYHFTEGLMFLLGEFRKGVIRGNR